MKVDWAILSNGAELRENLAYVLGGGIDTVNTPQVPTAFMGAVLLRFLVHRSEAGRAHKATLRIVEQDGREIARLEAQFGVNAMTPDFPVEWEIPAMFAINLHGLQLQREGEYAIEILGDDTYLTSLRFRVKLTTPPPQGPGSILPGG
jgi:hypothetical protein